MAKLSIKPGSTSQALYVFIRDSSVTTGAGLTGLAFNTGSLVASYVRPLAARTAITLATQTTTGAFSSGGFVEVDATNMPGVYRFDIPDAAIATGVRSVVAMLKGAANMEPCVLEIDLNAEVNATHLLGTAISTPATAGILDVNTKNINNVAAATPGASGGVLISGSNSGTTTLGALTVTGATTCTGNVSMAAGLNITQSSSNTSALVITGNGTGHGAIFTSGSGATGNGIQSTSAATNGHGIAGTGVGTGAGAIVTGGATGQGLRLVGGSTSGAALALNNTSGDPLTLPVGAIPALGITDNGTAQSATGTTLVLRSAAAFADDELIGASILITGGSAGVGQVRVITDYVGSTDTATVDTWTTTPTGTITYAIFGGSPASASLIPTVDVAKWNGTTVATPATAGIPDINVKNINNVVAATPGASGGILISGSNSGTTTLGALTITGTTTHTGATVHTGNVSMAAGLNITQSSSNTTALVVTGNGTGNGATFTSGSGATGQGINISSAATNGSALVLTAAGSGSGLSASGGASGKGALFAAGATGTAGLAITGGATSGAGITVTTTAGDAIQAIATAGNGLTLTANGTSKHGAVITGGTAGTSDGLKLVAGTGGVDMRAAITGNITGTTSTSAASYQKNVAANDIPIVMVDSTDHVTRKTGLTVTCTRSIDGAAFGAATGTVSEVASGVYVLDASQADMNGNNITFRFTGTAADPVELHIKTYT